MKQDLDSVAMGLVPSSWENESTMSILKNIVSFYWSDLLQLSGTEAVFKCRIDLTCSVSLRKHSLLELWQQFSEPLGSFLARYTITLLAW